MEGTNLAALLDIAESATEVLMPSQMLMLLALPVTLLLAAVEWRHFRRGDEYDLKDSLASVVLGGSYVLLAEGLIIVAAVVPLFNWLYQFRLTTLEISPATLVVLFLLVDLCFYLFHRAAHRIRFFWAVHEVHHGSEYFNFTVAFRQSVMYAVTGVYLFFVPAVLLGFRPEAVLVMLAANMTCQIFVHTQWVKRLPAPIEWLFNTPSNHRVHHGRNPRYIDRNLGGVLMLWDHLFGTYVAEDPADPPDYGVVHQIHSHNPLTLTFHEWRAMLGDVARPGPLALRLKHLWAPPEWQRPESTPALMGNAVRADSSSCASPNFPAAHDGAAASGRAACHLLWVFLRRVLVGFAQGRADEHKVRLSITTDDKDVASDRLEAGLAVEGQGPVVVFPHPEPEGLPSQLAGRNASLSHESCREPGSMD